ncbi:MAG: N-formylglutamate amidohydrolase [Bacilli bacterium]|nr:N-formylglutamate amidohydrolase [Bacilli bacterium]
MQQVREDGSIKLSEPYTKAIALYLNRHFNVSCMIKINDTGSDANKDNMDKFKIELMRFIKDNDIKLVIDLHGADRLRNFDIEFGTLNNLSADFSTIKELEEAFIENGINYIEYNKPFKGGAITQYIYNIKDVDVIQIEINKKYRDINDIDNLQLLCKCFEKFIKQYQKYMNKKDSII